MRKALKSGLVRATGNQPRDPGRAGRVAPDRQQLSDAQASHVTGLARTDPRFHFHFTPTFGLLAQCRRKLLRQADPAAAQARCLQGYRRSPGRHQSIPPGSQRSAQGLHLDRRSRRHHRKGASGRANATKRMVPGREWAVGGLTVVQKSRRKVNYCVKVGSPPAPQRGDRVMKSLVEELRAEARRLIETANNSYEIRLKKELSECAFRLSECAEAIANSMEEPEIFEMNIRRSTHASWRAHR